MRSPLWPWARPLPPPDQPLTITCAARDLWHGVDPYTTYEPQCLSELHARVSAVTPLEQGPFASDAKTPTHPQQAAVIAQDQRTGTHHGFPPYGYPPLAALRVLPAQLEGSAPLLHANSLVESCGSPWRLPAEPAAGRLALTSVDVASRGGGSPLRDHPAGVTSARDPDQPDRRSCHRQRRHLHGSSRAHAGQQYAAEDGPDGG